MKRYGRKKKRIPMRSKKFGKKVKKLNRPRVSRGGYQN